MKLVNIIFVLILIVIPITLIILPSNHFDSGNSICISKLILNKNCFGCGMTRGIQHLIHLEIKESMEYNRLSLLVLPILIYLWFKNLKRYICRLNRPTV
jgi:hypothetical protein